MSRAPLLTARVGPASVWCSGREPGNVGDHTGADPRSVAQHRRDIAAAAGLRSPNEWVWLRQVHGAQVYDAHAPTEPDTPPEADAAVTAVRGLPLAIVTADCAPVVIASDGALAVAHAGYRGLAAGVLEAAVGAVRARSDGAVHAFLGPCIHPECYEFGAADLDELITQFGPEAAARTRDGAPAFDIPAAVRIALARAGVDDVVDCGVCTADSPAYFSYRAERTTSRQVTVAVLT